MLACGAIAFTRESFGLLRQTFQSRFQLPGNFANSFSNRCLGEKFRTRTLNLDLRSIGCSKSFGVRLFNRSQRQRTLIGFFAKPRVFLLQTPAFSLNQNEPRD